MDYRPKTTGGFTLVELMVSLGLFIVVVMAAISTLYSINRTARRVEAMRTVLDNLNFAIESMSRTIRTGTDVGCGGVEGVDCTFQTFNPGEQLTVFGTLGRDAQVDYRWVINAQGTGEIQKTLDGLWIPITAPGIDIPQLSFFVDGADPADGVQPSVIMMIQGVATAGENVAPFAVQTQVSLRTIE